MSEVSKLILAEIDRFQQSATPLDIDSFVNNISIIAQAGLYDELACPNGVRVMFDGKSIQYSDHVAIECDHDEDFDQPLFNIYHDGVSVKMNLTKIEQAHKCALREVEKREAESKEG